VTVGEQLGAGAANAHIGGGLVVDGLTVKYGHATAVHSLSFAVAPGEVMALLGANGAGKSSTLNAISGLEQSTGEVLAGGMPLAGLPPERRAALVAQVPEGRRLFPHHTVRENLLLGAFSSNQPIQTRRLAHVFTVLPRLAPLAERRAELLSGGEQQMVALGRGLMSPARVLMIDELSLGLAPTVTNQFADALLRLRDEGYAILLVEQYIALALRIADRVVLLDHGVTVLQGTASEVRAEAMALEHAYLGGVQAPVAAETEVLEAAAIERSQATPTAYVLGSLAGLAVFLAATFMPWLKVTSFTAPTRKLDGWGYPLGWILPPLLLLGAATATNLSRLLRVKPSPIMLAVASLASAAASFGLLFARMWSFGRGLGFSPASTFQREWGLLLAVNASSFVLAGSAVLMRETLSRRGEQ
jgi:branched-chain amino acid transport system ATP-binding protein